MLGFDYAVSESVTQTRELDAEWEKVLRLELWEACNKAGRLLAHSPKEETEAINQHILPTKKRLLFVWGAH